METIEQMKKITLISFRGDKAKVLYNEGWISIQKCLKLYPKFFILEYKYLIDNYWKVNPKGSEIPWTMGADGSRSWQETITDPISYEDITNYVCPYRNTLIWKLLNE